MRILLGAFILCAISACGDARSPVVDRIEMRVSGSSGLDITVNRQGTGSYHLSGPLPDGKSGTFSLPPGRFEELLKRLAPYRREAVPFTEESGQKFALYECPDGLPFVTDAGGVYVRWIGPNSDQHYLAGLGCDADRHAARNKDLLAVVQTLPVPLDQ